GLRGVHLRCGLPARRTAQGGPWSRRLRRLCHLRRRSDSYRMERPVIRTGIAPAEDPSLYTAHCYRDPASEDRPVEDTAARPRDAIGRPSPIGPAASRAVGSGLPWDSPTFVLGWARSVSGRCSRPREKRPDDDRFWLALDRADDDAGMVT